MAFLYRLLPPRPTFNADLSPDEAAVMERHGAYWMGLVERGVAVVFGPVLDPKGVWGLAIIDVEDDAEATSLSAADPAVTSGVCTYELHPMQLTTSP